MHWSPIIILLRCDLQRLAHYWFYAPGLQLDNEVSQSTDQPHGTVCYYNHRHRTYRRAPSRGHWLKMHLFSTAGRHWDIFVIMAPDINIQTYLLTYWLTDFLQQLRLTKSALILFIPRRYYHYYLWLFALVLFVFFSPTDLELPVSRHSWISVASRFKRHLKTHFSVSLSHP